MATGYLLVETPREKQDEVLSAIERWGKGLIRSLKIVEGQFNIQGVIDGWDIVQVGVFGGTVVPGIPGVTWTKTSFEIP